MIMIDGNPKATFIAKNPQIFTSFTLYEWKTEKLSSSKETPFSNELKIFKHQLAIVTL